MKRILITGASGFLGSHLVEQAKGKYEVYGLSSNSKIDLPEAQCYYFSITNSRKLSIALDVIDPQVIIHCAAISSENGCKNDKDEAIAINVTSTQIIANWSRANNARMIFTSTDLVFDGENAPYDETTPFTASLFYGQLKREAELAILNKSKVSIVRLPLLYGIGLGERKGLLFHFIEKCKKGEVQGLFEDEFRNPVWVKDIAEFLLKLLDLEHSGILHLGGKERLSRFELGQQFCEHLNLSSENLKTITRAEIGMQDRPKDTTMTSKTAYDLGFKPKDLKTALIEISKHLN